MKRKIPLASETNDKYEYGVCGVCGGCYVFRTFAVDDGQGCIDWDFEEWCEECDNVSGGYLEVETDTEYGKVKVKDDEDTKLESIII